jgi:ParB-like chromosome segregation protein Spo0J
VAASIKAFGWVQPIVCDREDVIVIGHLRLAAAHFLGLSEVPVHVASNLSPAQIKALRIADNRTHEEADRIEDLLSAELLDLKSLDFDLGLTGFDSREISALIDQPNSAEDEVPTLPAVSVSRLGDLWLLGPHRVLCADSTHAGSVERLVGERKPSLLFATRRMEFRWIRNGGIEPA